MDILQSSTRISLPEILLRIQYLDRVKQEADQDLESTFSDSNCVTYNTLKQLDFDNQYRLGPGAYASKVKQGRGGMMFVTVFEYNNSQIFAHQHNCVEYISIISGQLQDLRTGKSYYTGDFIKINPWKLHHFIGARNTVIFVEFKKANIIRRLTSIFRR